MLSSRLWTISRPENHKIKVVPSFGNVLLSLFREEDAPDQDRCNAVHTCPELGSPMPGPLAELIPPPGVFWSDLEEGKKLKYGKYTKENYY